MSHLKAELNAIDYAEAIQRLLPAALKDCGGSRTCAMVLLNAHNGDFFNLDITDLCLLDEDLYSAAMVVIRGRVELRTEPHELLPPGNRALDELWARWNHCRRMKGGQL